MRKMICLCITGILLLSGCGKSAQAGTGAAEETALKDNQEVVYGQIETIVGNDMTIALAEAEETEVQGKSPAQMTEEPTSADGESQAPGRDSMPDMGEMPSDWGENLPEGMPAQGEMPGKSPAECGNYINLDVETGRRVCRFYADLIRDWTVDKLAY